MTAGRVALRDAIKATAKKSVHTHQPVKRGTVTGLTPLTVQQFGFTYPFTLDNDFELSGWMTYYQHKVGLKVDDLVLLHHAESIVLFDVVTDTDIVTAFGG